jgi:hypothetical protein
MYILDQITGRLRPPAAVFEPRLPENRPKAKKHDAYLSVNVRSSLANAGEPCDWRCDHAKFYAVTLTVADCQSHSLNATWEPIEDEPDPNDNNPHHGGICGVVEMFRADREKYEAVISGLAKASEILPECLAKG